MWCGRQFLAKFAGLVIRDNILFLSVHLQKIITIVPNDSIFTIFLQRKIAISGMLIMKKSLS